MNINEGTGGVDFNHATRRGHNGWLPSNIGTLNMWTLRSVGTDRHYWGFINTTEHESGHVLVFMMDMQMMIEEDQWQVLL